MTFIDWSNSEGMFDLLVEFIRDEMSDSRGDANRQQFLAQLLTKVSALNEVAVANAGKCSEQFNIQLMKNSSKIQFSCISRI